MPSSPDMKIWLALRSRLDDLASLTSLAIEWPNNALDAPAGGYLRVRHLPNAPLRPFHASDSVAERLGVVQVMCYSKRGGAVVAGVDDTARAMRVPNLVAAHFPQDQKMVQDDVIVRVMSPPRVGEVVNPTGSAYAECLVEIPYRCFA